MYQRAIDTSPKRQQLHYGLARLYLQLGRLDEATQVFKHVRDFDLENGIGYWNYGLTLMYDKGQTSPESRLLGAQEIKLAMEATYPYALQSPQEIFALFDAYIVLKDAAALENAVDSLARYPRANAQTYAQIAFKMETLGLTDLREKVLVQGEALAPGTVEAFEGLIDPNDADTVTLSAPEEPADQMATSAGAGPRR